MANARQGSRGILTGLMVFGIFLASPAETATFTVNSTADAVDALPGNGVCATGTGACTLRAAIQEANALAGADTIILPFGNYTLTIEGAGEDAAATGDLDITGSLILTGENAANTIIEWEMGLGRDRMFHLTGSDIAVAISGVTIRNGNVSGFGGGILNSGALTLTNSAIRGNIAWSGGGLFNSNSAAMTLTNVTISDNVAHNAPGGGSAGGGVSNEGTLGLTNSTVSLNLSDFSGGGISNRGTAMLTNSTVSENVTGGTGGGGFFNNGTARFKNTILADNTGGNCSRFAFSTTVSLGHNLDSRNDCGFTGEGDLINTDPRLGPLANNGGPTQTHALLAGSPAIDAGDNLGCPVTDQRGEPRPVDGNGDGTALCDIGAYEFPVIPRVTDFVLGLGTYPTAGGWVEVLDAVPPHAHKAWFQVPWPAYNARNGETRPVTCDLDGDGKDELVIGLGPGAGGWVEVRDDATTDYAHLAWFQVNWPAYNQANGETFPACRDLDGDGRAEIVLGLGTYPIEGGWMEIRDDALAGFAHRSWAHLQWPTYNAANGLTRPAVGQ